VSDGGRSERPNSRLPTLGMNDPQDTSLYAEARGGLGRSASSARARTAICRTSTGDGSCTRAKHARSRCGSRKRAPSRIFSLRCGILIYTATAGAQGTLGGLVGTAPRFAQILEGALERSRICSNDPICADHQPDNRSGDRATHGAACHGCLLIAATSCKMRNLFLDRSRPVPTMGPDGSAFFRI
jgi:hypothetical protein